MATEEPKVEPVKVKITSQKPKDPKKVEAGKRLAAISREAKERKKKEREAAVEYKSTSDSIDINYLIAVAGIIIGLGSLYYSYKDDKREEKSVKEEPKEESPVVVKRTLDSLE